MAMAPNELARRIEGRLGFQSAVLFAAGGAGEFFTLTFDEFSSVISAAVLQASGHAMTLTTYRSPEPKQQISLDGPKFKSCVKRTFSLFLAKSQKGSYSLDCAGCTILPDSLLKHCYA